jgi:hypothetical protein
MSNDVVNSFNLSQIKEELNQLKDEFNDLWSLVNQNIGTFMLTRNKGNNSNNRVSNRHRGLSSNPTLAQTLRINAA